MWESWFNSSVNISYFLVFCLSLSQPKKKLLCPLYLLCWISTDETHLLNLQSISSSVWLAVNKPWFYFFSLILDHCFSHPSLYSGDWIFCVFTLTLLWLRINAYLPVFLKMLYSLFSLWVFSFIVLFAAFIQWIQKPWSCSPELHTGAFSPGIVGFHESLYSCVSVPSGGQRL